MDKRTGEDEDLYRHEMHESPKGFMRNIPTGRDMTLVGDRPSISNPDILTYTRRNSMRHVYLENIVGPVEVLNLA